MDKRGTTALHSTHIHTRATRDVGTSESKAANFGPLQKCGGIKDAEESGHKHGAKRRMSKDERRQPKRHVIAGSYHSYPAPVYWISQSRSPSPGGPPFRRNKKRGGVIFTHERAPWPRQNETRDQDMTYGCDLTRVFTYEGSEKDSLINCERGDSVNPASCAFGRLQ